MLMVPGAQYTIKVDSNALFNFKSEGDIKERVALNLSGTADVDSVVRPLFTQYYMLHVSMTRSVQASTVTAGVRQAFKDLGFDNAAILSIERGAKTTSFPKEVVNEAVDALAPVAEPLKSAVKYLVVVLVLAAGFYAVMKGGKR